MLINRKLIKITYEHRKMARRSSRSPKYSGVLKQRRKIRGKGFVFFSFLQIRIRLPNRNTKKKISHIDGAFSFLTMSFCLKNSNNKYLKKKKIQMWIFFIFHIFTNPHPTTLYRNTKKPQKYPLIPSIFPIPTLLFNKII